MTESRVTLSRVTEVEIRGLTKVYHTGDVEVHALRGIDLVVQQGEFVAIVGPSGSGKSTLFHILGGLTPPTAGTVAIEGQDLTQMSDAQRTELRKTKVGFVFQKYNLLPTLTAQENIEIARDIAGTSKQPRDAQFEEALKLLGIGDRMRHKPRALSGGEQQRVGIARGIVTDPTLLLCDEPTGDLDRKAGDEVLDLLQALNQSHGKTIIMVTHDPHASRRASRTVYLNKGQLSDQPVG